MILTDKKDGVIIVNDQKIEPITVVTGAATYPDDVIAELSKTYKVLPVDAMSEARKLGNTRVFNTIVLGLAAQHMDFSLEDWYAVIEKTVKPKTVEINKKAFAVGYQL